MADLQAMMGQVQQQYPPLKRHAFQVQAGQGPYYSEMYPPWEGHNPVPGMPVIELHQKGQALEPEAQQKVLLGETFHYLGARNPQTQEPIDPAFRMMKEHFQSQLTPQQIHTDRQAYLEAVRHEGETRSFEQWMDQSRLDAYLRGGLSPLDETERQDWTKGQTPQQRYILQQMQDYLSSGILHP